MTDQPDRPDLTDDQKKALEQVERVDVSVTMKRPGVLTFIGILVFIQAAMSAVQALALFVKQDDSAYQAVTGQTGDELLWAALIEVLFAVVFFLVGVGIMTGWGWSRLLVAVVYGFRLAVSGWYILTHIGGGINTTAIIQAGFALFVLWALYGNDKSERFFAGGEASFGG